MRRLSLLLLTAGLAACASDPAATPGVRSTALPNEVTTEPLTPQPIRIRVEDLPPPRVVNPGRRDVAVVAPPEDPVLRVPAGFRVNVWADGLSNPRWLALTPAGDVLVAETRWHRLRRLRDADGDGAADSVGTFADRANGLDFPLGMAFARQGDSTFFVVGSTGEVRRYRYRPGLRRLEGQGERVVRLPSRSDQQHWARNVIATPDGDSLVVAVGSRTNVSPEELPRASVFRVALDGSGRETLGAGLRNPVGLAFHPATGALYTVVSEREGLGDDLVPDFLARIGGGAFFGWPYAYLTPDRLDPRRMTARGESEQPELAAATRTPDVLFPAHSAPLGLTFYDVPAAAPSAFPARYHGGAFVALRGAWRRDRQASYQLVFVPFEGGRPTGVYEDFLTGFLLDPSGPRSWGRPTGLLLLPDGSLLFAEEAHGRIYRVSYTGPQQG